MLQHRYLAYSTFSLGLVLQQHLSSFWRAFNISYMHLVGPLQIF